MKNLVRAEIETSNPKCVLITYDVDGQQIETCTVSRDAVEQLRTELWQRYARFRSFASATVWGHL